MTPQERELILGVGQRLRSTPLTEKDNEAERLIQTDIGSQPDALYRLTQAVIVQEQGLRHAQERIHQLEAQLQPAQQPRPGGFLSSLFGGGSPAYGAGSPPPPSTPYAAGPAPGESAAGSFLRSAAATAAGVVGGQLIYDGLRQLFGGSSFAPSMVEGFDASPEDVAKKRHSAQRPRSEEGRSTDAEGDEDVAEPIVTNMEQSDPGEDRSSISGGGGWQEEDNSTDDSMDSDDYLSGGGDFDTGEEDAGDHEEDNGF